jgi:hypothetical protein
LGIGIDDQTIEMDEKTTSTSPLRTFLILRKVSRIRTLQPASQQEITATMKEALDMVAMTIFQSAKSGLDPSRSAMAKPG